MGRIALLALIVLMVMAVPVTAQPVVPADTTQVRAYMSGGVGCDRRSHFSYEGLFVVIPLATKNFSIPIGFTNFRSRDREFAAIGNTTRGEVGIAYASTARYLFLQALYGLDLTLEWDRIKHLTHFDVQGGFPKVWGELNLVTHWDDLWARTRVKVPVAIYPNRSLSVGGEYIYSGWHQDGIWAGDSGWFYSQKVGGLLALDILGPHQSGILLGVGRGSESLGWYFSTELTVKPF